MIYRAPFSDWACRSVATLMGRATAAPAPSRTRICRPGLRNEKAGHRKRRPAIWRCGGSRPRNRRIRTKPRMCSSATNRRTRSEKRSATRRRASAGLDLADCVDVFDLAAMPRLRTGCSRCRDCPHVCGGRGRRRGRTTLYAMIDHISIAVRDIKAAEAFYTAVLGAARLGQVARMARRRRRLRQEVSRVLDQSPRRHGAGRRGQRRAYLPARGINSGGRCLSCRGSCGRRHVGRRARASPEYNERYYAAFIRDPDGNRIEAVTFV